MYQISVTYDKNIEWGTHFRPLEKNGFFKTNLRFYNVGLISGEITEKTEDGRKSEKSGDSHLNQ